MGVKTPPFEPYPEWTQARFFGFLRSALRQASSRWPPKYKVLQASRRAYNGENKRRKWEFKCAECGDWFPQKEVAVDHIIQVGTLKKFEDLPGFVERMFCAESGLQVLCTECHKAKGTEERNKK